MYGVLTTVVYSVVRWRRVAVRFTRHRACCIEDEIYYAVSYGLWIHRSVRLYFTRHGRGLLEYGLLLSRSKPNRLGVVATRYTNVRGYVQATPRVSVTTVVLF